MFCCSTVVGCSKFLDTKPSDFFATETYYETEEQLNTALIGVYDQLGDEATYGNFMFTNLDACTDESFFARSGTLSGVEVFNFDYTNNEVNKFWSTLFSGIERANTLIANINKPKMDETKRKQILAQARFLRGYYYFLLANNFGDVPLRTEPKTSVKEISYPRTPVKEVYEQILVDMQAAEADLPTITTTATPGRISKTAAQGILARVCLKMAGYPLRQTEKYLEALNWAKKVVASREHRLLETYNANIAESAYSQIFINHTQDKYDFKESMWEVEFYGNRTDGYLETGRLGNTNGIAFGSPNFADTGYSYGFINATNRLYKLYDNNDLRRDWAIAPYGYGNNLARVYRTNKQIYQRNCGKWRRSYETKLPKDKNATPTNFPILRYADVLLMLAEAENMVNGPTAVAYDAINQVRRRGFGVPVNQVSAVADLPTGYSKDQFQKAIQDERSRELCFETLRRFDLIRWGIFVQTMQEVGAEIDADPLAGNAFAYASRGAKNVTSRNVLFPIPVSEKSVNKLATQNPGW